MRTDDAKLRAELIRTAFIPASYNERMKSGSQRRSEMVATILVLLSIQTHDYPIKLKIPRRYESSPNPMIDPLHFGAINDTWR